MRRKTLLTIAAPVLVFALLLFGCGPTRPTTTETPTDVKPPVAEEKKAAPPAPVEPVVTEEKKVDTLAAVKARGVLVVGVRDTAPPFGTFNPATKKFEGYDIDFANYIANRLGVGIEFKVVTASNRIPMLEDGRVDMLAAAMSINPERAKRIDFSYAHFITGQKFLAPKGMFKAVQDFEKQKVGVARGTTAEKNLAATIPSAVIVSFDDYPQAINALLQRKVMAVTTDEAILAGQLSLLEKKPATRGKFEIPDLRISTNLLAIGVRKNDRKFLNFVNETLLEMEKNGKAHEIFQRWFGPSSECPIKRGFFKISAE